MGLYNQRQDYCQMVVFFILFYKCASYSIPTVTLNGENPVRSGYPASFTCTYEQPQSDNRYFYLEWAKTPTSSYTDAVPLALTGFTYIAGGSPPNPIYPLTEATPEYTMSVDTTAGSSDFNITRTKRDSSGFYWCLYSSGNDPRGKSSVHMTVYDVSFSVTISTSSEEFYTGEVTKIISGKKYIWFCTVEGVTEPASLSWTIDGLLHNSDNQSNTPNSSDAGLWDSSSNLSMTADWSNHRQQLWCNASLSIAGIMEVSYVQLDVKVPPTNDGVSMFDSRHPSSYSDGAIVEVDDQQQYALTCNVIGTRPYAIVTWTVNHMSPQDGFEITTVLSPDNTEKQRVNTSSQMTFTAIPAYHKMRFECAATINVTDAPEYVTRYINLDVLGQSDPLEIFGNLGLPMVEGETETLKCIATNGYPEGSITWLLDGVNITETEAINTIDSTFKRYITESLLEFTPSKTDNGRTLTCALTRRLVSEYVTTNISKVLNVKYPPEVVITKSSNGPVQEGDSVTLTCTSDANPPSTQFSWVKGHDLGNGSDTLTLKSITHEQEGSYRCKAQNSIGAEGTSDPVNIDVYALPTTDVTTNQATGSQATTGHTTRANNDSSSLKHISVKPANLSTSSYMNTTASLESEISVSNSSSLTETGVTSNSTEVLPISNATERHSENTSLLGQVNSSTSSQSSPYNHALFNATISVTSNTARSTTVFENPSSFLSTTHQISNSTALPLSNFTRRLLNLTYSETPVTSMHASVSTPELTSRPISHTVDGRHSSMLTPTHISNTSTAKVCLQTVDDFETFANEYNINSTDGLDSGNEKASTVKFVTVDESPVTVTFQEAIVKFPGNVNQLNVTVIQSPDLQQLSPTNFKNSRHSSHVITNLISINANDVHGVAVTSLEGRVQVLFSTIKPYVGGNGPWIVQPRCSWWNPNEQYWTDEGCRFVGLEENHAHCQCDHLTVFALIGQVIQFPHTDTDVRILRTLAGVSHSISILFCMVTLIAYFYGRLYRSVRVFIHTNFVFAVLMSHVFLWVAVEGQIENVAGCATVAALAHLFALATYFWLLMEAIHLLSITPMFPVYRWFLICWGCPSVIMLLSVAANSGGYGYSVYKFNSNNLQEIHRCWLQETDGTIWAFGGPAVLIVMVNFALLFYSLPKLVTSQTQSDREEISLDQDEAAIRLLLIMEPILCLPWLFRLLYYNHNALFFDYAYVFCNALQGVFIFVNHCILDEEVLKVLKGTTVIRVREAVQTNKVAQERTDELIDSRTALDNIPRAWEALSKVDT